MKVIKLTKNNKNAILAEALETLKSGGTIVYPTDTSYGLGCNALDLNAIRKTYLIKERGLRKKPMHVLIPSKSWAKKQVDWGKIAEKLSRAFLPGPLSIALPLKSDNPALKAISPENFLGLRQPANGFALELVKKFGKPITATSANPSALLSKGYDSYSAEDVISQFKNKKHKPDLIIDAGRLKKNKPSTFIRIRGGKIELLRKGPIALSKILASL